MDEGDDVRWAELPGTPSPPASPAPPSAVDAVAAADDCLVLPLPPAATPPPHGLTLRTHAAAGLAAKVWPSALHLAAVAARDPAAWRGATVVELGCGPGAAGLALAAMGGHVLLTDLEGALVREWWWWGKGVGKWFGTGHLFFFSTCTTSLQPLARANADANAAIIAAAGGSVAVAPLPWGEADAPAAAAAASHPRFATPTVVVAADVVYDEALFGPLLTTLAAYGRTRPPPRVLVAHVRRWKRDKRFWAAARKLFTVTELGDDGCAVVEGDGTRSAHERGALRLFELAPR